MKTGSIIFCLLALTLVSVQIKAQEMSSSSVNAKGKTTPAGKDSSIYTNLIKQFQEKIPILMSGKNSIGVAVALTDENGTIWT